MYKRENDGNLFYSQQYVVMYLLDVILHLLLLR